MRIRFLKDGKFQIGILGREVIKAKAGDEAELHPDSPTRMKEGVHFEFCGASSAPADIDPVVAPEAPAEEKASPEGSEAAEKPKRKTRKRRVLKPKE